MKATKILMTFGHSNGGLLEIDSIYLEGCTSPGFYKKAAVHDYLKEHPGTIQVGIYPYPEVVPAVSQYGEKYVRSSPNGYGYDNLLSLPRV